MILKLLPLHFDSMDTYFIVTVPVSERPRIYCHPSVWPGIFGVQIFPTTNSLYFFNIFNFSGKKYKKTEVSASLQVVHRSTVYRNIRHKVEPQKKTKQKKEKKHKAQKWCPFGFFTPFSLTYVWMMQSWDN